VTSTLNVTALYSNTTYTVTPSAGTGGAISPSTAQTVTHGNTTAFTVTADTGYSIDPISGTCGGSLVGTTYTTNAITANCTVIASFAINNYTVTFDLDGGTRTGGGTLSQSITHGSGAIAPIFSAPSGKTFSGWSGAFSAITGDLTVTALYGQATHAVTPTAGTGGSISPATAQTIISGNATVFTITPNTGYEINSVTGTCGGNLTGNTYITAVVITDCTVLALFSIQNFTVTFDLDGGVRTGGGDLSQSVTYGSAATAPTFTEPSGKTFTGWSTTFSSITGTLTVTALYGDTTYTATPSVGTGGSISPSTAQTVTSGNTTVFTVTPDTGYSINSVNGTCGGNLISNTFTTNTITASCTVDASFILNNYTVTFDLGGGTRTGGGNLTQSILHGSAAIAPTLTAPLGKVFSRWSIAFNNVSSALTITALYSDKTYQVIATASSGGSIIPRNVQIVIHNNTVNFQVTPDAGYLMADISSTCAGNTVATIYTTAAIVADCALEFTFHKILKGVNEKGDIYTGEIVGRSDSRTISLIGGSGNVQVSASVKQGGIVEINSTSVDNFLQARGAKLINKGNGIYSFTANRAGLYTLVFTDQDGQLVTMAFTVYPTIGFTSTYQESAAGKITQVRTLLDDDPIEYPAVVSFTADGNQLTSDLAAQGIFTVASGRIAEINFLPSASSGDIDFTLTTNNVQQTSLTGITQHKIGVAVDASNLQQVLLGSITKHKVSLKALATVPFNLDVTAQQAGEEKNVVLNKEGTVTLSSSLTGAGYRYDWSGSASELGLANASGSQVTINPENLRGTYLVKLRVTELAAPNRVQTVEMLLHIVPEAPAAYNDFFGLDYQVNPNRLPICSDGGMTRVVACRDVFNAVYLETLSTYEITLGYSSDYASWRDLQFGLASEVKDIRDAKGNLVANQNDKQYMHLGYQVDFTVSALEQAGQTIPVVVPLKPGTTIPEQAVWRTYSEKGWKNFTENAENILYSAKRDANGDCPSPSATTWNAGLHAGDDCVRLIIQDGGPNDSDNQADGVVRDLSVLGVRADTIEVTTVGKGRGGAMDSLILMMLALCLLFKSATLFAGDEKNTDKNLYEKLYIGGSLAQAQGKVGAKEMNSRMAEFGYDVEADVSKKNRGSWGLFGGYEYSDYLALELGYIDLGKVRTRLTGSPVDINEYLNSANLVHPRSASGGELAALGRYPLDEKSYVYVRGGLLFATSRYSSNADVDFATRKEDGRDIFLGLGLGYDINDHLGLRVSWENYRIESENIGRLALGLLYKFSPQKSIAATQPIAAEIIPVPDLKPAEPVKLSEPVKLNEPLSIKLAVQFDTNSDVVKEAYLGEIIKLADVMNQHSNTKVVIEGHTDNRGNDQFNKNLSQRRAQSVRNILVQKFGIAEDRVAFVGYGEERPVAENATEQGRITNRRVMAEINTGM
jgi:outer membrane protein OmpA-like peptidoglycan-associated protein